MPTTPNTTSAARAAGQSYNGEASVCCHRITFGYWGFEAELTDELKRDLEESAEERAQELIPQGYHSGILNHFDNDSEAEILGWWQIA